MRLFLSNQWQPRTYLAPFGHNTSITDSRRTTDDNRIIDAYSIAVARQKLSRNKRV